MTATVRASEVGLQRVDRHDVRSSGVNTKKLGMILQTLQHRLSNGFGQRNPFKLIFLRASVKLLELKIGKRSQTGFITPGVLWHSSE